MTLLEQLLRNVWTRGVEDIATRVHAALRDGGTLRIGYLNAQVCAEARRNDALRDYLLSCEVLLADGAPVAELARRVLRRGVEKIAVTDALPAILAQADACGAGIALLGSREATQNTFARRCAEQYPRIRLMRVSFLLDKEREEDKRDALRTAAPDVLLVALGAPAQEAFLARHGEATGARVRVACGGAVDVLAGVKKRAPQWMHPLGIEWLYRLAREPRRLFGRYLRTNVTFLAMTVAMLWPRRPRG